MKTRQDALREWLERYDENHRHPFNRAVHRICVPLIVVSSIGLLWLVPAVVLAACAALAYVRWSSRLAAGMILAALAAFGALAWLDGVLPVPLWQASLPGFVAGWALQFAGHAVEGRRPSFRDDLRFLLIGPLWILAPLYRRAGIPF